jgi:hypothetical protein
MSRDWPRTLLPSNAAFHVVCSLVARGQMPPRARAGSSCRLLAMAKPIDGQPDGVRPLAVGEVLHRLVARAVGVQTLWDWFQQHFCRKIPYQNLGPERPQSGAGGTIDLACKSPSQPKGPDRLDIRYPSKKLVLPAGRTGHKIWRLC